MRTFKQFEGESAWTADDFPDDRWVTHLANDQTTELSQLAQALPANENEWLKVDRASLPLTSLGPLLDSVTEALETGLGFALLRGVDLPQSGCHGYSQETWAYRINWVLALALGDVIAQNAQGEVIGAVQAVVNASDNGMDTRGYVSNAELRFHCDGGDVASLLCVRQALEGGYNSLVSMHTIHNIMAKECPQHLSTLYRGLPMFMRAEKGLKSASLPRQPLFYDRGDHLLAWINLRLMELPYESAGEPMPEEERAALDAVEEIAERQSNKLTFKLKPGDMLLTHNHVCMHKRSAFIDEVDPSRSRLMLRLWYNVPGGRAEAIVPPEKRAGYFVDQPYVIRHTVS